MHSGEKHSCETQLITVINDWAKILGRLTLSFWTLKKLSTHSRMNYLNLSIWLWYWRADSEMDKFFFSAIDSNVWW